MIDRHRRLARILRRVAVVKTEEFLRCVGQQAGENLRGREIRVEFLGLDRHAQGVVVAADLHAFANPCTGRKRKSRTGRQPRCLFQGSENRRNIE